MTSPPKVVTSSACVAARRLSASSSSKPMSRYEVTLVSSQKTYSSSRSSARTSPSIAPEKAVSTPAKRPTPDWRGPKYWAQ